MFRRAFRASLVLLLSCGFNASAQEQAPGPPKIAVGVNVLGAQIDYQWTPRLRLELRYLVGEASSGSGSVSSQVAGARAYRIYRPRSGMRPYLGLEAAYVSSKSENGAYKVSGGVMGGFAGVERRLFKNLWIGVDAGPYIFSLREDRTRRSDTSLEFVANSFIMVYLF